MGGEENVIFMFSIKDLNQLLIALHHPSHDKTSVLFKKVF